MTFPLVPLTNQWTDFEDLNAAIQNARIDARLNALAAGSQGRLAVGSSTTTVNLPDNTDRAGNSSATIVLPSSRVLQVYVSATFRMASGTNGNYAAGAAYSPGSSASIGTAVGFGYRCFVGTNVTGANGQTTANLIASITLPAGTYTFFPIVTCNAGGGSSDNVASNRVEVFDVGAG